MPETEKPLTGGQIASMVFVVGALAVGAYSFVELRDGWRKENATRSALAAQPAPPTAPVPKAAQDLSAAIDMQFRECDLKGPKLTTVELGICFGKAAAYAGNDPEAKAYCLAQMRRLGANIMGSTSRAYGPTFDVLVPSENAAECQRLAAAWLKYSRDDLVDSGFHIVRCPGHDWTL